MSENSDQSIHQPQSIAKLALALSKAQGKIKAPVKNRHVDFTPQGKARVKYSYADLADVIDCIREPLAENELAIIHQLEYSRDGYGLTTSLVHSSGEAIRTWYPLPDPAKSIRAQEFGSALTYARRYSVSSLIGIASEEDDDGQSAAPTTPPTGPKTQAAKPNHSRPQPTQKPAQTAPKGPSPHPEEPPQQFPPDDTENPPTEPEIDPKDPGEFVVLFGNKTTGKKIRQLNEPTLREMMKWVDDELRKTPPVINMSHLFSFKTEAKAFLKSMGVEG